MGKITCPSCGKSEDIYILEEAMEQDPRLTNLVRRTLSIRMFEIPLSAPHQPGMTFPFVAVFSTLGCLVALFISPIFGMLPESLIPDWVLASVFAILLLGMFVLSIAIARPIEIGIIYKRNQKKIDLILEEEPRMSTEIWICKSENLLFNSKTGRSGSRTPTGIRHVLRTPRK
jgi:hypothetical protein